jgi:hypothetical protein
MPPRDRDGGTLSPNATLVVGLAVCAALVVLAVVTMRFTHREPPPAAPPPTAQPLGAAMSGTLKFDPSYYRATIERDAAAYKVQAPPTEALSRPLVYADELAAPRKLKVDHDQLDTPHLHLATRVRKEWSLSGSAARMRVEHVMLTITNKSAGPIAYRVETHIADEERCRNKAVLAQNAIALRPGETIERSECLSGRGSTLEVNAIEVMELSDLGYYYVSRLVPHQILLDERTSAGHEVPNKLPLCNFIPWRDIHAATQGGPNGKRGIGWADVIDFYARHDCDEYSYFPTYRRWTTAGTLPAQPAATPGTP